MSIIKQLPEHISNQIAAGEVIQRPSSVVKELIENAIDSGASEITVLIKDAGKSLIQVIDNGKGMNAEDSKFCFKRHATSKINQVEDLQSLVTKGFRGEALSSIASIAHVCLKTKRNESDDTGFETIVHGGDFVSQKETTCSKGCSFEVKNLFFNVPARRNFLKSDSVEFNHIRNEMERICLAHCDIKFILIHNNQELMHLVPGNLKKRIIDVFGNSMNESLIPIKEETNIVKIEGFISKPEKAKKSRGEQFFFVNNRFFKDSYFHHSVVKSYERLIPEKTYPAYFIFFNISPEKIDVNIHPTKTEIKFEEDRFIYSILNSAIRQALGKYNIFPSLDFERETSFDLPSDFKHVEPKEPHVKIDPNYNPFSEKVDSSKTHSSAIKNQGFDTYKNSWEDLYSFSDENVSNQIELLNKEDLKNPQKCLIHGKYLILNMEEGFLFVDSKRAAQRVIFDQIMEKFQHQPIASQQLMFPEKIALQRDDIEIWESNKNILQQLGFDGVIDQTFLELKGIPNILTIEMFPNVLYEIIETLKLREVNTEDIAYKLISKLALIASLSVKIKTNEEAIALIDDLFTCTEYTSTSTGKKVLYSLSLKELSQNF